MKKIGLLFLLTLAGCATDPVYRDPASAPIAVSEPGSLCPQSRTVRQKGLCGLCENPNIAGTYFVAADGVQVTSSLDYGPASDRLTAREQLGLCSVR